MITKNCKPCVKPTFIFGVLFILLTAVLFPSLAQAAPPIFPPRPVPGMPPRPTSEPEPKPEPVGALIELRVQFDQEWSWTDILWQELDTVVQWQDDLGNWHDVEGWRGGLDEVKGYEGRKSWWMPREHFGTGPFRWVVYRERGEELLAASELFYMPRSAGEVVRISVPLSP